jgi:hypothetical protein
MFTLVQHMTGKVPGPDFPPKVFLVLRETSSASIATMLIVLIAWLMPASVPKAEPAED